MKTFYFEVRNGEQLRERIQVERPNADGLQKEAAELAADLLRFETNAFLADKHWSVHVTNADRLILFSIEIAALESAAMKAPPSSVCSTRKY